MKMQNLTFQLFCLCIFLFAAASIGSAAPNKEIAEDSRCPVCGMFVAKYPQWITQLRFKDDSLKYFDGVKDMMRFYFAPEKYGGATVKDIQEIWVKDYYTLQWIDGTAAHYVVGSDVLGPMGTELIPFVSKEGAEDFLRDHKGKQIFSFPEIKPELIQSMVGGMHKMKHKMKH